MFHPHQSTRSVASQNRPVGPRTTHRHRFQGVLACPLSKAVAVCTTPKLQCIRKRHPFVRYWAKIWSETTGWCTWINYSVVTRPCLPSTEPPCTLMRCFTKRRRLAGNAAGPRHKGEQFGRAPARRGDSLAMPRVGLRTSACPATALWYLTEFLSGLEESTCTFLQGTWTATPVFERTTPCLLSLYSWWRSGTGIWTVAWRCDRVLGMPRSNIWERSCGIAVRAAPVGG